MSEVGRILGIFTSPKTAFADIVERPRWYIPVIILTVLAVAYITAYSRHVGFERLIQQSMQQNSRVQNMPPEQRERAVEMGTKFGAISAYAGSVVGVTISTVVVAAVLMLTANGLMGAQLRFVQMLGITAYAFLTGIVTTTLSLIVMFLKPPEDFDIRNPLAFNPGAFLNPESTPKWLVALATSFDLLSFWTMALLALGITVAARKLSFGKALAAVLLPWIVFVLLKTGWIGLFG